MLDIPRLFQPTSAVLLLALALALPPLSCAQAQSAPQAPDRVVYPVKFICGPSSESFQEGVVSGFSATEVTILNPSLREATRFSKRVSRALPYQTPGDMSDVQSGELGPMQAMTVECNEIRQMLPSQMTSEFRSGYLLILADAPLVVTAVYSARPSDGEVSTLDVEVIAGQATGPGEPERLADLTVSNINIGRLVVRCPNGQGSCVAAVPVTVSNIGAADAGPFQLEVRFDPGQSTVVNRNLPGLAAGASSTITIQTPASDNCFDPDCTICAFADSLDAVQESDESNNKLCRTRQG